MSSSGWILKKTPEFTDHARIDDEITMGGLDIAQYDGEYSAVVGDEAP
jgi:hypothetical protein